MLNNVLLILLGAGLVTLGFLAAALAERIRDVRGMATPEFPVVQERGASAPAEMPRTPAITRAARAASAPAEMPRAASTAPRTPSQADPSPGDEVITALVAAGYKRPVASQATWACDTAERATIEKWTASALRRCGRGDLA